VFGNTFDRVSEDNVAVVRRMWEAFLCNDFETSLSSFDPDVEWDGTNLPDGKIALGLDAVMDHITRWAEMWERWEVELEDVIDAGDGRAIAFIRERGRSKAGARCGRATRRAVRSQGREDLLPQGLLQPRRSARRGRPGLKDMRRDRSPTITRSTKTAKATLKR
jgi:ketosteroid isomerase-like protein